MSQTEQSGSPRRRAVRRATLSSTVKQSETDGRNSARPASSARPSTSSETSLKKRSASQSPAARAKKAANRTKQPQKKIPKPTDTRGDSTALSSLIKALIYIIAILVVSGALSYFGITAGNDIFAFKKSDELIEITVGEDLTVGELAEILSENRVIRYRELFVFYAQLRKKDSGFIATTETVSPSMSYDELLAAFKEKPKQPETIRVTIPEGYTVDEIIDLFVNEYGVGTREGFIDAIQNYPYDYWFVQELDSAPLRGGRTYRLEGYLYPDTYYFYTTSSEISIINKLLANFEVKFADKFRERARELEWSIDDVIILASMIQMEAKYQSDYGGISSVFHNRLSSNKTQGKLESDATIQYVLDERTEDLTEEMLNLDSPYNTRLYAGLPPGPITNVTLYAINYALFPSDTDYYYFNSRKGGYTLFSKTYAEHLINVERARIEALTGTLPTMEEMLGGEETA